MMRSNLSYSNALEIFHEKTRSPIRCKIFADLFASLHLIPFQFDGR